MIQGTGSHVGKSVMVAGLCRALRRRGLRVAPFKPQNMSNNAAVADDGGEIGRAQALQARAAGLAPSVHMNPVLLKPESETGAQVIVQGRRFGTMRAAEFGKRKSELLPFVLESFARIGEGADIVLVEGAGSPAEVNLRRGDIANMGFAEAADIPVVLIGDIDRGGVIASLVGTHAVLGDTDRARIRGFVINKFRGDAGLFSEGLRLIDERTGWPSLGVVPWFEGADALPAEDVLGLVGQPASSPSPRRKPGSIAEAAMDSGFRRNDEWGEAGAKIVIAVPALPLIANFDDLDPLRLEPGVSVVIVHAGQAIPASADLVLLPGSKSTIADLIFIRAQGWDIDILAHHRRGGRVLGLCGGYQMLGRTIADPEGVEGSTTAVDGLGLLDIVTVMNADKTTSAVRGRHLASGQSIEGYEIHLGRTSGADCARPFVDLGGRPDGAQSEDGRVAGTYVHGLFASDGFRCAYLQGLGGEGSNASYEATVEAALDGLAGHLEQHVAIDRLLEIAGIPQAEPSAARGPSVTRWRDAQTTETAIPSQSTRIAKRSPAPR
jgi:adenosylcobyric acid synthase